MNVVAGVVGILFAALHGGPSLAQLRKSETSQKSQAFEAVPVWARFLWLLLSLITLVGSVAYLISHTAENAAIITVGATGIWLLAIANGFWIHGRPTFSHHLIRGVILVVLLSLTFLGLG